MFLFTSVVYRDFLFLFSSPGGGARWILRGEWKVKWESETTRSKLVYSFGSLFIAIFTFFHFFRGQDISLYFLRVGEGNCIVTAFLIRPSLLCLVNIVGVRNDIMTSIPPSSWVVLIIQCLRSS
jgi:hypothetical protein